MRLVRRLSLLAACLVSLVTADPAAAQFTIGGDPRVNPADFRITTFATGLNYPNGLARLSDGSILVATNNPNGSGMFFVSSGALLRFTDTNDDGIADGPGQVMYSDPVGVWTGLAVTGNMVFVISAKDNANRIIVLKMNNGPASPYTFVGTLNFTFPAGWEHKAYAMTTRPAPGAPAGTWELYFNVGSSANFGQSADTVGLSGLLTGTMQGGSIYRVTVTETGLGATVSNLVRIAAGLRNAAGMAFHPTTSDLYFEDNGIDGLQNRDEPLSADELNRVAAADLGRIVPDFGFPNDYIDYHTGQRVGSGGVQPLVAFLPLPCASCPDPGDPNGSDGAESEGPSGIIFAPPSFPSYLNNGVFIGFHGKFGAPPSGNEENPLVFWDLGTGNYFHFIESFQLGHGDQLLSTEDSLFIADMASDGSVDTNGGTGVIYQIKRKPNDQTMSATITTPGEGSTVAGTVPVGMSETGGSGTIVWTLRLDSDPNPIFTTSGTASTVSFSWDASGIAPGAHTLRLTVQDGAGKTAAATRNIIVAGPLTASFTSPAEGATVSGTVPVGMSETGGTGTTTWTLRLDSGTTPIFTTSGTAATASFNWDASGVTAGAHTLRLTVSDGAGRTATATRNVTVAAGGTLRVAITQPAADGATVKDTTWFVFWVEGAAAGTKTYTLSVGGTVVATTTDTSSGPISMGWNTKQFNDGPTTVIASARDSAGNTGSAPRVVNIANGQQFVASFTSPAEGATVSGTVTVGMSETGGTGTPIVFTLTVDGIQVFTTSGTATTASFNWNSNSVADGPHTLGLTVRDGGGRTATATRNVTVTTPTPIPLSFTSPPEGATVGGTITVSVSESGGTGTLNWTISVDDPRRPPDGTIVFCISSGTTSSLSCSFDTTMVADGPHTLTATVQDGAGRKGTATRRITVTQPALSAAITSPAEGATVSGTVPVAMSETGGTGTISWTLRLDGGSSPIFTTSGTAATASFNWDTTGLAPGAHQLQLTVQDGGARTATATRNVTVGSPGTIKVFITQPGTDGTTVSGTVWFTIWLENAAAGTRNLTLSIDGTAVATTATTANGPISMPWNSTGASGGTHTATVSVRDSTNNTGSANRTVVIAGGPPPLVASFTSPAEGATVFGNVTVGMSETGASGTPIVFTLTVDGTQVFTTSGTAATASFNWNANSVPNGPHTLGLTVRDGAGRTATATRSVTVTDPPPLTASFTSPAEGASVTGVVTIGMAETGASGTPITFTLTIDGIQRFTTSGTATSASYQWDTTALAGGQHVLSLVVTDGAGRSAAAERRVVVDSPYGELTAFFTSPEDAATVQGTVTVGMSASTGGAPGPVTFTLTVDGTQVFTTSGAAMTASYSWDTTTVSNNGHTLGLTVRDGAGRTATASRSVFVQNPSTIKVFITQPGADGATVSGTTWFTIWLENAAAGNKTYTMSVGTTPVGTTNTTSNGPVSMPWNTATAPNGSQSVTITVRDSAGGTGQAVRMVTVSN